MHNSTQEWLMSGDPSIRFQTSVDIIDGLKVEDIRNHRMYIELEGWGREILDLQSDDGIWGNGLIKPEYTSTIWALTLLRRIGLEQDNPNAQRGVSLLLQGIQADGRIQFSKTDANDVCISALVLSVTSYFRITDGRRDAIFEFLIEAQMDDNGWNCEWNEGATHSSFQSTLLVLEAFREYGKVKKDHLSLINDLAAAGNEFLLGHSLFLSHKTGEIADHALLEFVYLEHKNYDVLSALDYFRSINHPYDIRFSSAIDYIKLKENDGQWFLDKMHEGDNFMIMETPERLQDGLLLK